MDPAVAQAISAITGALVMLIIAATSYYFPRGVDRFDRRERERDKRESERDDRQLDRDDKEEDRDKRQARHKHRVEEDTDE